MATVSKLAAPTESRIPAGRGASRHLAKILRGQLASGEYGPGDRLPTHRMLMHQFNVGYSVANRAMEILARDGLIQRQQGQGSFVRESVSDAPRADSLSTFALVLGHPRWSFNLSLCQGSDAVAGQLHYQTVVCETENDVHRQASVLMQLIASRVGGIALVPTTQPETPECQVRVCQDSGIPVVLLHRSVKGVSAPLIALPFEEIGYRAGKALLERGHRRVAMVFDQRYVGTERYEAGLRRALDECDGGQESSRHLPCAVADGTRSVPAALSVYCGGGCALPMTPEYQKFLDDMLADIFRMSSRQRPTAIVAIAENDAEWMYLRLMNMAVRVPEQISLITVGNSLRRRAVEQQLSAVTIDEAGVGQLAAQLLSEMRGGQRRIDDTEQFVAELGFHIGQTLGPVPMATGQAVKEGDPCSVVSQSGPGPRR
jgi:GntR family transcriptional regulator, arabinose operon transcriptional repressor